MSDVTASSGPPPGSPTDPPPGPPPGGGGAEGSGGADNRTWLIGGIVVLVALIAAAVVYVVSSGDDDEAAQTEGEIFLEPAASLGPDPFSSEVLEAEPVAITATSTTGTATSTTESTSTTTGDTTAGGTTAGGTTAVSSVQGGAPGLYGGTQNNARCDREAMIAFLEASPDKAAAWVAALNGDPTLRWSGGTQVTVNQIGAYIRELTPITLTRDTRVTNHGFRNGQPTPRQTVLQAGSGVLVDIYGVPRARCGCGNPLIPPQQVPVQPVYTGDPWTGWNPTTVVVVTQVNVQINIFILVDIINGGVFERAPGTTGDADRPVEPPTPSTTTPPITTPTSPPPTPPPDLGSGDVQVTLTWSGDADLDLHVADPAGTEIFFGNPTSPSGGSLDTDKIPDEGDGGPHFENVFWPTGGAPSGNYEAWVFNIGGYSGPASFTLEVFVNGAQVASDSGSLGDGAESQRISFSF